MKKFLYCASLILLIGLLIPQTFVMPVYQATKSDYNQDSFWYYPWSGSGAHKGVDIFTNKKGVEVVSATHGLVIGRGHLSKGGNFVLILGPKWRIHYYAHLQSSSVSFLEFVSPNKIIGIVGNSGNAAGKQPHIHYSIMTLIPYIWRIDSSPQGWKKMFYLNPITFLNDL
ncbi:MAG: M23 family metallopeptidase [Balneola sp.]|nr:MAG: M23 family metallopeptidase [Balneola sp.]